MKKLFELNLDKLIESATREALSDVLPDERRQQDKAAAQMRNYKASKKKKNSIDSDIDETESEVKDSSLQEPVNPKDTELPEITLGRIVDKLNSIRAGNSLKSKEIKQELDNYFTRLNGNERVALYAFLSGLEKIVGSSEDDPAIGDKTPTPAKDPYKIKMKKTKPKVDKKPAEGTDSPIVVGESADKSVEKRLLRRNQLK